MAEFARKKPWLTVFLLILCAFAVGSYTALGAGATSAQPEAGNDKVLLSIIGALLTLLQLLVVYLWTCQDKKINYVLKLLTGEEGMNVRLSVLEKEHELRVAACPMDIHRHARQADVVLHPHQRSEDTRR